MFIPFSFPTLGNIYLSFPPFSSVWGWNYPQYKSEKSFDTDACFDFFTIPLPVPPKRKVTPGAKTQSLPLHLTSSLKKRDIFVHIITTCENCFNIKFFLRTPGAKTQSL